MRVDSTSWFLRSKRGIGIAAMVLAALVIPSWLWVERGRNLQIHVVLQADQYLVSGGTRLPIVARILPTTHGVSVSWSGPGVQGAGTRALWTLPTAPGVYTVAIRVRRSRSVASDRLSVRVLKRDPRKYSIVRPAGPPQPPPIDTPLCTTTGTPASLRIHGKPCVGANIVAELVGGGANPDVWWFWPASPGTARFGRMVNLRIPANFLAKPQQPDSGPQKGETMSLWLTARTFDTRRHCGALLKKSIAIASCRSGPRNKALFADFGWQLVGPSAFRLSAKPARIALGAPVRYEWDYGDGIHQISTTPVVVHRYNTAKRRYYMVRLVVLAGQRSANTVKRIVDRSAPSR